MMTNRIMLIEKSGDTFYEVHDWQTNETIFVSEDLDACRRFIDQLKKIMMMRNNDRDEPGIAEHWLEISEVMNPHHHYSM